MNIGQAVFLASVAAFFIPTLVASDVSPLIFIEGLISSLTLITFGIIILKEDKDEPI